MKTRILSVFLIGAGLLMGGCSLYSAKTSPTTGSSATTNIVSISGMAFAPVTTTIAVGTTVTWTNQDGVGHTVTGDGSNVPSGFDSGTISNGQRYSFTFATSGTYTYHCAIHPQMKGTIIVR